MASVCGCVARRGEINCSPSSQGTASRRMLWITVHLWLVDSLLPTVSQWIRQLTSALGGFCHESFQSLFPTYCISADLFVCAHTNTFPCLCCDRLHSLKLICLIIYSHSVYNSAQTPTPTRILVSSSHERTDLFTQFTRQLICKTLLTEACFLWRNSLKKKKKSQVTNQAA